MARSSCVRVRCICAMFLLCAAAGAQTTPNSSPAEQAAREQKGLAALHEAIAQSQNLTLPVNRIFIESTAAELLWTRDEPLARSLVSSLRSRFRELAAQPANDRGRDMLNQQAYQFRRNLVITIARQDPQLALDFLHATPPPAMTNYGGNYEADLELNVAAAAAQSNARLAASLVRQNMSSGNSMMLASTVEQISRQDSAAGAQLAAEMMNRLSGANFSSDQRALMAATQLIQYYGSRARESAQPKVVRGRAAPSPLPISDAQVQALAQAVYTAAQKPDFPANWLPSVQNVMPQLQNLVPSAAPLRGIAGQPSPTFWNDLNMALQKGNMDQAVGMAAAAPPDYRYSAFQSVAMNVAGSTGNLDAAREILNRSDIPEGQREQMMEQLAHQAAVGDAARGATAQARAAADLIRYTTDRAQAYIQIAQAALGRKDKATAAAFLNDAAAMLPSPPADAAEVNALGSLASAYLQIDPARSAEILSGLIDLANEKFPALAVVDGFLFNGMRSFYNGEMVMQYGGGAPLLSAVSSALYSLAATDSDRAMALAARLQRPEAKVTAYLGIARALLGSGVGPGYGSGVGGGVGYGRGSGFITISH